MSPLQEKEIQLRVDRLKVLLDEARTILEQDEPIRKDLLTYANRISPLVQSIEKVQSMKETSEELKYFEIASPTVLDAEEILNDLNTRLKSTR